MLISIGTTILTITLGCLQNNSGGNGGESEYSDDPDLDEDTVESFEQSVIECEQYYIEHEIITNQYERIDGPLNPEIIERDPQPDGLFVKLKTTYGTRRRHSDDEPEEYLDYQTIGYYFVSDENTYRTSDSEKDPREGTKVDCDV